MSIYVLLDGQPISAYTVEDTWVEFEDNIYFVYYIDADDNKIILDYKLDYKSGDDDRAIPISTEISFKSVEPKLYKDYVIYIGEDVTEPTVMRIVEYSKTDKYSYKLEAKNGEEFWATPYELESIDF